MKNYDSATVDFADSAHAGVPHSEEGFGGGRPAPTMDPDWDEACRIAEQLGFGQEATRARRRSPQNFVFPIEVDQPELSPAEQERWEAQETRLLDLFNRGDWKTLATSITEIAGQDHPLDPATLQQLHYLACALAGGEPSSLPEENRHEGGTLVQALADLCRLLQLAVDEDLEWAFDQGLEDLSPYLVGDRPAEVRLLNSRTVTAGAVVQAVVERLGELFGLEQRIGRRFVGTRLYFQLRELPGSKVPEQDFLRLSELAGDQAFFHSFLGRQELVHWRHDTRSIRSAFEHLWRAYQRECEYTEEPQVEIGWLGGSAMEALDEEQLQEAFQEAISWLSREVRPTLAGQRFLRHVWRKFLREYTRVLVKVEHPDCLKVLLQIRTALIDEIESGLEFAIARLAQKLKHWNEVEESYLRGLALEPDNLDETLNLAAFYKGRSRYQEARSLLTKALRQKPGDPFLTRRLRSVADRMDLQNQVSPFLTDNPGVKPTPPEPLEQLGNQELLSIAAMTRALRFDDGGHLRSFSEAPETVFPNEAIRDAMVRELLSRHAMRVYRYSPEHSYRVKGAVFDFDMEQVEWMLNAHSTTYPDRLVDAAAITLLQERLSEDHREITRLWRWVASHDLLQHAQRRFQVEGWFLDTVGYVQEVADSLLCHLPFNRAVGLIDMAVKETRAAVGAGQLTIRQAVQEAIRNIQSSYEKAIFKDMELAEHDRLPDWESTLSQIFRLEVTRLEGLFYQAVPGEVDFVWRSAT